MRNGRTNRIVIIDIADIRRRGDGHDSGSREPSGCRISARLESGRNGEDIIEMVRYGRPRAWRLSPNARWGGV